MCRSFRDKPRDVGEENGLNLMAVVQGGDVFGSFKVSLIIYFYNKKTSQYGKKRYLKNAIQF